MVLVQWEDHFVLITWLVPHLGTSTAVTLTFPCLCLVSSVYLCLPDLMLDILLISVLCFFVVVLFCFVLEVLSI